MCVCVFATSYVCVRVCNELCVCACLQRVMCVCVFALVYVFMVVPQFHPLSLNLIHSIHGVYVCRRQAQEMRWRVGCFVGRVAI